MMRKLLVAASIGLAVALAGCTSAPETEAADAEEQPVIVFAAASLQGAFDELADVFEEEHPEFPVAEIRYDGSQALAAQLIDGADVDVIAFANEASIEPVLAAGVAAEPTIFATNTLQIAVAPGNPRGIEDLSDLTDPALTVVLCAPEVPCGTASQTLLADAGVSVAPASEETNVSAVVRRVVDGEADAGLVYATDVAAAAGQLEGITPENAAAAVNRYPISVASDPRSPAGAEAFAEFVLSAAGQAILAEHGFGAP